MVCQGLGTGAGPGSTATGGRRANQDAWERTCQERTGQERTGQERTGQERTG